MRILEDAARRPDLFWWFGVLPEKDIRAWLRANGLRVPDDLVALWVATGGGDVFESKTILRPNVPHVPNAWFVEGDDIESANPAIREKAPVGMFLTFAIGLSRFAIEQPTLRYVSLSPHGIVNAKFSSLDAWYEGTIKKEFAARYGL